MPVCRQESTRFEWTELNCYDLIPNTGSDWLQRRLLTDDKLPVGIRPGGLQVRERQPTIVA
jgi:hypothetical protein